jgi:hypothetical protein
MGAAEMAEWKVLFENKWGSFPGTITAFTVTVKAVSYGEAVERASRKVIEDWFKVSATKVNAA